MSALSSMALVIGAESLTYQHMIFDFGYQLGFVEEWTPTQVVQEILMKGTVTNMDSG